MAQLPDVTPSFGQLKQPLLPDATPLSSSYQAGGPQAATASADAEFNKEGNEIADKQNAIAAAQAKSDLMSTAVQAERAAEQDPNPVTAKANYDAAVQAAIKKGTGSIPGVFESQEFKASSAQTTFWSDRNMEQLLVNKQKQQNLGTLDDTTQKSIADFSTSPTPEQRTAILQQHQQYLTTMKDTGVITPEEFVKRSKEYSTNTSLAYYEIHPDELQTDLKKKLGVGTIPQSDGMPADMGADTVKPYTPSQVANVKGLVSAPSEYDALFQKYGKQYGVDPQELKLHAAAESGMDPTAANSQAAGLMQLTKPTADSLGVTDRLDPEQSIMGAAKLMAQQKVATGGDTRTADKLYYGGADQAQWGKNTEQYAENLAAVRGQPTGAAAQNTYNNPTGKPIDNIPAYEALQIAKEANARGNILQTMALKQQKEEGEKAQDEYLKAGLQGQPTKGLVNDPRLNFEQRNQVLTALNNVAVRGEKTDPAVFNDMLRRAALPEGDPDKLTDPNSLIPYIGNGLTYQNKTELQSIMEGGEPGKDGLRNYFKQGHDQLSSSSAMNIDGEGEARAYKWYAATQQAIADGQKKGVSMQELINPNSKDYVGNTVPIDKFRADLTTQGNNMAQKLRANTPTTALPADKQRQPNESAADYVKRMGL